MHHLVSIDYLTDIFLRTNQCFVYLSQYTAGLGLHVAIESYAILCANL